MLIDEKIEIRNKTNMQIQTLLKDAGFYPMLETDKTKTLSEKYHGYDYLLSMDILSLTRENLIYRKRDCSQKQQELQQLIQLTPKDLWNNDLDEFLGAWDVSYRHSTLI